METSATTLVGVIVGGFFRIAPELLKVLTQYIDNKHELAMLDKSNQIKNQTIEDKIQISNAPIQQPVIDLGFVDKLITAQTIKSGFKWVDMFTASIRPQVTFILLWTYVFIKCYFMYQHPDFKITDVWSTEDMGLLGGILGFWFLGRVLDKR